MHAQALSMPLGETLAQMRMRMTEAEFQKYVKAHAAELAKPRLTAVGVLGIGMMLGAGVLVYLRRRP